MFDNSLPLLFKYSCALLCCLLKCLQLACCQFNLLVDHRHGLGNSLCASLCCSVSYHICIQKERHQTHHRQSAQWPVIGLLGEFGTMDSLGQGGSAGGSGRSQFSTMGSNTAGSAPWTAARPVQHYRQQHGQFSTMDSSAPFQHHGQRGQWGQWGQ